MSSSSQDKVMALNIKFVVKAERRQDFIDAIKKDQQESLAKEPGVLQFVVGQGVEDPNVFLLHEQYKTASDLDHHESTPHFAEISEFFKTEPFSVAPVIDKYLCPHDAKAISHRKAHCLNVESCIKPEFRDEFLALSARHQKDSLAEPGCIQFDWGESSTTPNTFYVHEQYVDKDGYDAHEKTAHFDRFMVFNQKDPYSKPQVVSHYTTMVPE